MADVDRRSVVHAAAAVRRMATARLIAAGTVSAGAAFAGTSEAAAAADGQPNAQFYGSMGGQHLNAPIVGMSAG